MSVTRLPAAQPTDRGSTPGRDNKLSTSPKCLTKLVFNGYRGLCPGVKQPGREAEQLSSSDVEVENGWSCTASPSLRFHGMYGGKFCFT